MDTRRARIYNGSKKVDAIYKGSSATPMYTWEEKEVMVGMPERIPYTTENSYDSSLLKWESHTVPGRDGYREYYGNVDVINGKQVGQPRNTRTEVATQPVPAQNIIGTKTLSGYGKSNTVAVGSYASTEEHPVRKQIVFSDYKFPVGTEVVVTYRVSGGGISGSHTSGRIGLKMHDSIYSSFHDFTAYVDTSDTDAAGNPLCVIISNAYTTTATHYGEYISLYISQDIYDIYDVNVYFEEGEKLDKLNNQNTTARTSSASAAWYVDSRNHADTLFMKLSDAIYYSPQGASFAPYIAVKLDRPVKRGEKWVFMAEAKSYYPTTHEFQFQLGSTLTWSNTGKTYTRTYRRTPNSRYHVFEEITYDSDTDANYMYISLRGNTGIGSPAYIQLSGRLGMVAINLTSDGQANISTNNLLAAVTGEKDSYSTTGITPLVDILDTPYAYRNYSSNGRLFYNFLFAFSPSLDDNAEYIIKTVSPPTMDIRISNAKIVGATLFSTSYIIEKGFSGGIVVKGSDIRNWNNNDGIAPNLGFASTTPPSSIYYLQMLRLP